MAVDEWPPHVVVLLRARSHGDEQVVADWFEEQGLERLAFIFRSGMPGSHFWRGVIAHVACASRGLATSKVGPFRLELTLADIDTRMQQAKHDGLDPAVTGSHLAEGAPIVEALSMAREPNVSWTDATVTIDGRVVADWSDLVLDTNGEVVATARPYGRPRR